MWKNMAEPLDVGVPYKKLLSQRLVAVKASIILIPFHFPQF
jgi:hypothetical protein